MESKFFAADVRESESQEATKPSKFFLPSICCTTSIYSHMDSFYDKVMVISLSCTGTKVRL